MSNRFGDGEWSISTIDDENGKRYRVLSGTDWRGDATFTVYDHDLRISIATFGNRAKAEAERDYRNQRDRETAGWQTRMDAGTC